ncbi:MAG: ricin-type beta-trefoil lectin domain protein [Paucibacter sp.]|nr:ricin-type beta-trefoil lectin domain protein [Roseateles sp.]
MKWSSRLIITLVALGALASAQAAETSYNIVGSAGSGSGAGKCLDSNAVLSPCGGAEQRFVFGADGTVYLDSGEGKRYLQGNLFASNSIGFSNAVATGNASTYWSRPGGNRLQLSQSRALTAMCLSRPLSVPISVPLRAELAQCSASAANQQWTLANPLPVGQADPGKTQVKSSARNCLQQTDFTAPLASSKLTVAACTLGAKTEYFQFTNQGAVVLNGYCLSTTGGLNSAVGLGACGDTGVPPGDNQKWKRGPNASIVSNSTGSIGLCLELAKSGTGVELQNCEPGKLSQYWITSTIVAGNWPAGLPKKPTTYVPNQTLSSGQVNTVVNWIQRETSISTTPFCYKTKPYDRGAGILPDCADGQYKDGGLCYNNCRSGYHGVGPVCWSNQSLSYPSLSGCRDGYTHVAGVCWLKKASYGNGAGKAANSCKSNRVMQAGLCYENPRSGYQCNASNCNQRCAAGIADCGVAACASNANQCVSTISNMVVSTAIMFASFATAGAAGEVKIGVMAAKDAVAAAKTADDLADALVLLSENIEKFLLAAENELAGISSVEIEAQIAARYPRGKPDYQHIAREWAARNLLYYISDLLLDLNTLIITTIDPTGITGVMDAFAKPPCMDHTSMP